MRTIYRYIGTFNEGKNQYLYKWTYVFLQNKVQLEIEIHKVRQSVILVYDIINVSMEIVIKNVLVYTYILLIPIINYINIL